MKQLKYFCARYRPYLLGVLFFVAIFVIWWLGVRLGFSSLYSLLAGILAFLVASLLYLLLLYRTQGGQRRDVEALLVESADDAVLNAAPADREEISLLRERMLAALERMKRAQTGKGRGREPLYALPWYLVIGQPAAGKSTLVYRSGLDFPFAERESARVKGVGGTRHCDWFFSSQAVLLDTAGRYVSDQEEVGKWRAFLELLKRHRPRRPLNGLIVAVGIDDLLDSSDVQRDALARRLRERIQETHELLGAVLPIYLVFTKSDLIPGFRQFHAQLDPAQRDEVLGATFPHRDFASSDWQARFSAAIDALVERCRAIGERHLVESDVVRTQQDPAALEFPLELRALAPLLGGFATALLTHNPYQSAPLLRGFYLTSALADGLPAIGPHARAVAQRFLLSGGRVSTGRGQGESLFVAGLFSRVILPDQHLVGLYVGPNRARRRQLRWCWAAAALAAIACGCWGLSYWRNSAELGALEASFAVAVAQDADSAAGYTRWASLDALREETRDYYLRHRETGTPLSLRFGLYRGHQLEAALRQRYFARLDEVMLAPVADNLNRSLFALPTLRVHRPGDGQPDTRIALDSVAAHGAPRDNTPQALASFGEATLATYLMLSRAPRDQIDDQLLRQRLPDYWYPAIEASSGSGAGGDLDFAGRQIDFYAGQLHEPDVPRINDNAFLISSSRNYIDSLLGQSLRTLETITLEADALFAFGRADFAGLQGEGQSQLNQVAARLVNTPNLGRITITGHADTIGSRQANQQVSLERAHTVRTYLVGKGLPGEMIEAVGAGDQRPLVECSSGLGQAERIACLAPNRRVEIEVRALE